eukprot:10518177-Alexandrium_andersonii.AAC.1
MSRKGASSPRPSPRRTQKGRLGGEERRGLPPAPVEGDHALKGILPELQGLDRLTAGRREGHDEGLP